MQNTETASQQTAEQRDRGLTGGYGGGTGVGNPHTTYDVSDADAQATARHADPDDLGSTDLEPSLTSGGTDTGIDQDVITEGITGASDDPGGDAGVSDEQALGMGMDDSSGYLDEEQGGAPA